MNATAVIPATPNIQRDGNTILFHRLDHAKCASDFLRVLRNVFNKGYQEVILEGSPPIIFPNALLPICGIIEHYKNLDVSFVNIRSAVHSVNQMPEVVPDGPAGRCSENSQRFPP